MGDFPASTQHLMLNEMNTCMGSESVHRVQHKLNLLSETMFPLLADGCTETIDDVSILFLTISLIQIFHFSGFRLAY